MYYVLYVLRLSGRPLCVLDIEHPPRGAVQQQVVEVGGARVLQLPPIDSLPSPTVSWHRDGAALSGVLLKYHVTLQNDLVILDALMS